MNYTEEFDGLLMDPGLIHYANQMHSKEDFGAGIFEDFEMSSLPDEPAEGGSMYSLVAVTCDDGRHWRVASIPIRNARDMEAFAKRKGARHQRQQACVLGTSGHESLRPRKKSGVYRY